MKKTRLAAIDIGTNSIRCIVVEAGPAGRFKVLDDEKATVRLGDQLGTSGAISPAAFGRAIEAVSRIRMLIDGFKVNVVEAVATSAVRVATNGPELVEAMSNELGREIRVISGEEEAELTAISGLHNFDMSGKRYAMVDIGGGSVEVVTAQGNHVEEYYSLDLGAVVMSERFFSSDPIKAVDYRKFQRHVTSELKRIFSGEKIVLQSFIGSGGTITSLGSMVMNMRRESYSSVHGYETLRSELVHLLAMLLRKDLKGKRAVPGLNPDRADIIVAGLGVLDSLMEFFGANTLLVNERGIREGLVIRAMKRLGLMSDSRARRTWRSSVLEFARSCHVDEPHSKHVASLCLAIFDRLGEQQHKKSERKMLEAAALLHDIGYLISYSSHHKHSYHLIRHADLFGFTQREREMTAQIARYHRKSLPKRKHEEFSRLPKEEQQTICRLGGILRLADGLDRRRSCLAEIADLYLDLGGDVCTIRLKGREDISVEIFGGNAKKDLFEKAYGTGVVFVTD